MITLSHFDLAYMSKAQPVVSSGESSFSPTSVAGLDMWYKADAGILSASVPVTDSGSIITTWTDQSPSGNDLSQPAAGNAPKLNTNVVNGKPALRFYADDVMTETTTATANQPTTYFVVMKWYDTNLYQVLFDNANARYWLGQFPAGNWDMFTNGGNDTICGAVDANYNVICAYYSGSVSQFLLNKTGSTTYVDPGTAGGGAHYIGRDRNGSNPSNMDLCEFLRYTCSLSQTNKNSIINYLGTKYGIAIT